MPLRREQTSVFSVHVAKISAGNLQFLFHRLIFRISIRPSIVYHISAL